MYVLKVFLLKDISGISEKLSCVYEYVGTYKAYQTSIRILSNFHIPGIWKVYTRYIILNFHMKDIPDISDKFSYVSYVHFIRMFHTYLRGETNDKRSLFLESLGKFLKDSCVERSMTEKGSRWESFFALSSSWKLGMTFNSCGEGGGYSLWRLFSLWQKFRHGRAAECMVICSHSPGPAK